MKYISYNEQTKIFMLKTKNSSYQMQVKEHDVLVHLYYGANIGETEMDYQIICLDRGFSGNPCAAKEDRTFSLDVFPQEFSVSGNGDYRVTGLEVQHEDGSNAAFLQYKSYTMMKGKYSIEGMPAVFADEDEAETLIIILEDRLSGLLVKLMYGVIFEKDVITRSVEIVNAGEKPVSLKKVMSIQMDYFEHNMEMIHFSGRHTMERQVERHDLYHGVSMFESKRGSSSHQHNPFMILCDKDATETYGSCYGYALVYSGGHICKVEVDQYNQTRLVMGIHPYQFNFTLQTGECFKAPEVVMAYSENGLGKISNIYHDLYRDNLIRSKYVKAARPILVNNWEATYFDFNEEKLLGIAKKAQELGLDMFVMDDGWFGKRDDDNSGLGDWWVNEKKLKGGLPELVEKINALGLKFGLWIEPEMVSEDSDLFREHPDWCLRNPGRGVVRSRNQLNLDVSRKEVRDHIMDQIFLVLDSCKVDYIKWDMNRSLENVYSAELPADRQGEVYHKYVLGVYDMMERLITRYPDLLFENCSGGGGRFDAGMLYYSPQIWCSDNTDAIDRLKIQYGTSFGYPISTMGAHVSVCPNHQTGRTTPFETRAVVASAGTFGYELDLEHLTEKEMILVKEQIKKYKEVENLIQTGDYFRLTNPFEKNKVIAWEFISKDGKEILVNGVQLYNESNTPIDFIKLTGLEPDRVYRNLENNRTYTGNALMKAGIPLKAKNGDYQPIEYRFHAV